MKIKFNQSPFVGMVDDLLRELSQVHFFEHSLLIGSWPMVVYSKAYGLIYGLRTNDIDFAVVNTARRLEGTPLPVLLGRLGYEVLTDYLSGIEKYVQDTFEIEFLMHRRGGAVPPAVDIPAWQVTAQPLPFIDILFLRPVTVHIQDYSLRIPSPEALMVHKLIVAQRRTGSSRIEKKEKDLQQCSALATIVRADEVQKILQDKRMSKAVQRGIMLSCEETGLEMDALGIFWPKS